MFSSLLKTALPRCTRPLTTPHISSSSRIPSLLARSFNNNNNNNNNNIARPTAIISLSSSLQAAQHTRHYTTNNPMRCSSSKQVAIVGAGAVGSTIALCTMMKNVASEILLVDSARDFARGQTMDLNDANIVNSTKVREGTFKEAGQAEVIVITAGAKQQPGESRQQLVDRNYDILKEVIGGMQPIRQDAVMMLVSNPVDVLTLIAQNLSGLPRKQVFGSGTFLDTSRLTVYLSDLLNVSASCVHAYVLGEHGDSQFIAWDAASVAGRPLLSFPEFKNVDKEKVRLTISNKAMDIIQHKGSTSFGIGACGASLCESILRNSLDVRPLSVYVDEVDTVISVPAKLGASGIEEIMPIPLAPDEQKQFLESAATLKAIGQRYN